ncbi:hypothetical protein [Flavobacterium noncentrifugens]|uniref:Uncharacterized protein n=1 Tax=Flavobacterium noncentrifugens TaxID=1128970 RepID=A0A1G9B0L9_9FLAO|nr:hypothetical protein [Flavobacterium noncentrifugens]SDK32510.1 hypothetical protein SAMN04487935_3113 [Flavobacterium noncentrifugens]
MKKIIITLSIIILAVFSNVLISCSNDSEMTNNETNAKSSVANLNKLSGGTGPIVNAPLPNSHKLVVNNNTNTTFYIPFIYAAEGPAGNYKIAKKEGTPITVSPMSTITYVDFVTAVPSSYSIPQWTITNNTTNPPAISTQTAAYTLANYGIQNPSAQLGVKYTYWTGADVFIPGTAAPSNFIGRSNPTSFQVNGITVSWVVQSNGDCVINVN